MCVSPFKAGFPALGIFGRFAVTIEAYEVVRFVAIDSFLGGNNLGLCGRVGLRVAINLILIIILFKDARGQFRKTCRH